MSCAEAVPRNEPLRALHPPSGGDDAAQPRRRARRRDRLHPAAGGPAAPGGLSDHLGNALDGRREPGRHGGDSRDAARAPSRADRRCHRDDLLELDRCHAHRAAVRARPRHRRRRARCRGSDQRRARGPADRAAQQSDLSQGEPGGRAGPHSRAHLATPSRRASSTTPPRPSCSRSSRRCGVSAR